MRNDVSKEGSSGVAGKKGLGRTVGSHSVERALSILNLFIGVPDPLSLAELTRAANMVKPTVLRCLISLERSGYIVRLPNSRYQLGAKVLQLGATYQNNFRLEEHVLPALKALADETGESASFHVREADKRLCLFRVQSSQAVRDYVDPALAVTIDATATGFILEIYGKTEEPLVKYRSVFSTSGIYNSQTASLSTAVFGVEGVVTGAITLSGPVNRFGASQRKALMGSLAKAADHLSLVLGAPKSLTERIPQMIQKNSNS